MRLRARQNFHKYRIERRLNVSGFATVYQAFDTIEGIRVALKVPVPSMLEENFDDFLREVRLATKLEHRNILPLRFAGRLDGLFVIVSALGEGTLEERLQRRLASSTALDFSRQALDAAAFAHHHGVMHCDIKPENLILFPGNRLRLTDFGIAKVASRTIRATGSGTIGYVAPEQAMGHPSFRSDVFSLALVIYRMFSGRLPEWPYEWPLPGNETLRRRVGPEMVTLLRRALHLDPRKRFADAGRMLDAFRRIGKRALRGSAPRPRSRRADAGNRWRETRLRAFQRIHGRQLETRHRCGKCQGPVSEAMLACPWCGAERKLHRGETTLPRHCPRCRRGVKLDWNFCAWCYGGGFEASDRRYSDRRYRARCPNTRCTRKSLMQFMRYCPWCRTKVRRRWTFPGADDRCRSCGWDVLGEFWSFCPWCAKGLPREAGP